MFQDVLFLQNWHTGDRPNIELRCHSERMKFQKSSKIWQNHRKFGKNHRKFGKDQRKLGKNHQKFGKNSSKSTKK